MNADHREEIIIQVIKLFKKNKGLPFSIRTKNCPDKKKYCRKKHGEIKIEKYDVKKKRFFLVYYSMHVAKPVFKHMMDEKLVKKMLIASMKQKTHGGYLFLSPTFYKKFLEKHHVSLLNVITFKITTLQKEELLRKSNRKGLTLSAYIKSKLFY